MRKGITPIISIIVLLVITIALAGAAWSFLNSFMATTIAGTFTIPTNGLWCENGEITLFVANNGQSNIASSDFKVYVNNTMVASTNFETFDLVPGDSAALLDGYDCGTGGCARGHYPVRVGTTNFVSTSVYCT
jgi:flagellin-like protein